MAGVIESVSLKKIIRSTLDRAIRGVTRIDAVLYNTDKSVHIPIRFIESLTIIQDFHERRGDYINLGAKLQMPDYKLMVENIKDLLVTLSFMKIDPETGKTLYSDPVEKRTYKALLANISDLDKQYHSSLLEAKGGMETDETHSMMGSVDIQLISPKLYDLRKKKTAFIAKGSTVRDALLYGLSSLGVESVSLIEPDNTRVYENLTVDPFQNYASFIRFLQEEYGIYPEGCGNYYTDDIYYLYPRYRYREHGKGPRVNIINAPQGSYSGMNGYTAIDADGTVSIVSDGEAETTQLSGQGEEMDGNSVFFVPEDLFMDGDAHSSSSTVIEEEAFKSIVTQRNTNFTESNFNAQYGGSRTNTYPFIEKLVGSQVEVLNCTWSGGVPFSIPPNGRVLYHYDSKNQYKTQIGYPVSIRYSFVPLERVGKHPLFICVGKGSFYLDPEDYTKNRK